MSKGKLRTLQAGLAILCIMLGRKFGIRVRWDASVGTACTDGRDVRIPPIDQNQPDAEDMATGYICHEAAHIAHTDFDGGQAKLSGLHRSLYQVSEDIRIEVAQTRKYPGTNDFINRLVQALIKRGLFGDPTNPQIAVKLIPTWITTRLRADVLGQHHAQAFADTAEVTINTVLPGLPALLMPVLKKIPHAASTKVSVELAGEMMDILRQYQADNQPQPQPSDQSDTPDGDSQPEASDDAPQGQGDGEGADQPQQPNSSGDDTSDATDGPQGGGSDDPSPGQDETPDASDGAEGQADKEGGSNSPGGDTDVDAERSQGDANDSDGNGEIDGTDSQPSNGDDSGSEQDASATNPSGNDQGAQPDANDTHDDADDEGANAGNGDGSQSDQAANATNSSGDDQGAQVDDQRGPSQGSSVSEPEDDGAVDGPDDQVQNALRMLAQAVAGGDQDDQQDADLGSIAATQLVRDDAAAELPENKLLVEQMPYDTRDHHSLMEVAGSTSKIRSSLIGLLQTQRHSAPVRSLHGRRIMGRQVHRLALKDPTIFKQVAIQQDHDTYVHLLGDESVSMNLAVGEETRFSLAQKSLMATSMALECIPRVTRAVSSFPGNRALTEPALRHLLLPGETVRETRFDLAANGSNTPLAEALMALAPTVLSRPERRKIVVVATDGEPNSVEAAIEVIQLYERSGIEIIGIGMGFAGVATLFGNYRIIQNLDELPSALIDTIGALLLKAA